MNNANRIYLNYSCIENAHLSDDECALLVDDLKVKADRKFKKQTLKNKSDFHSGAGFYNPDAPPINTKCGTWREPLIRKIVAQWNDLYNKGKVKNRSLESCRVYCKNQSGGIDHLEWFTKKNFNNCIEGLKAWQER